MSRIPASVFSCSTCCFNAVAATSGLFLKGGRPGSLPAQAAPAHGDSAHGEGGAPGGPRCAQPPGPAPSFSTHSLQAAGIQPRGPSPAVFPPEHPQPRRWLLRAAKAPAEALLPFIIFNESINLIFLNFSPGNLGAC